ncbi:MAG: glycosyltransferase family 4 protein [Ignavibacteriales bacterium]|nr:glycosyltransferase family 4 protein [Ignavibacteriales bacterium]
MSEAQSAIGNRRCRILLLTDRYSPSIGGVEKQCRLLAGEFSRRGQEVTIITDRYDLSQPAFEFDNGVSIHRIVSLSFLRESMRKGGGRAGNRFRSRSKSLQPLETENQIFFRLSHRLYRFFFYKLPVLSFTVAVFFALLRYRNRYDIVQVMQTHWLAIPALVAGRLLTKPVVAREATIDGIDVLNDFPFRVQTKRLLLQYGDFVSLSKAISANLRDRGVPPERIHHIPNSVFEAPQCEPEQHTRHAVLFIGNVTNDPLQKGLDILMQAWKTVVEKLPRSRLTIVGAGDFSGFRAMAGELKILEYVSFAGVSVDLSSLFSSHNIFVLPSRYEGMSNALLEAMSFGKACVVSTVSGSDDLIENHVTGIKVEPRNAAALADALLILLQNPEMVQTLGTSAQHYVRTHHSPASISEQYLRLYTGLIAAST